MSQNTSNPGYQQQQQQYQQQQQQQQQHGFPQHTAFAQPGFPFPAQLDSRSVFTPQQPAVSSSGQPVGNDPFNSLAATMIQQSGSNYLERGQEFVKSRMGFINSSSLHYHFNVDAEYGETTGQACCSTDTSLINKQEPVILVNAVRNKLVMLLVPVLKRWTYTRTREQVTQLCQYSVKCPCEVLKCTP